MKTVSKGFTLIELVMVILVTAILAVFAAPKVSFFSNMDSVAAADRILPIVSSAQKNAVASRRTTWIVTTPGTIRACYDAACATPITDFGGNPLQVSAPNGTGISSSVSSFSFDTLGRTNIAANVTITFFGRVLTIEQETGLIWST